MMKNRFNFPKFSIALLVAFCIASFAENSSHAQIIKIQTSGNLFKKKDKSKKSTKKKTAEETTSKSKPSIIVKSHEECDAYFKKEAKPFHAILNSFEIATRNLLYIKNEEYERNQYRKFTTINQSNLATIITQLEKGNSFVADRDMIENKNHILKNYYPYTQNGQYRMPDWNKIAPFLEKYDGYLTENFEKYIIPHFKQRLTDISKLIKEDEDAVFADKKAEKDPVLAQARITESLDALEKILTVTKSVTVVSKFGDQIQDLQQQYKKLQTENNALLKDIAVSDYHLNNINSIALASAPVVPGQETSQLNKDITIKDDLYLAIYLDRPLSKAIGYRGDIYLNFYIGKTKIGSTNCRIDKKHKHKEEWAKIKDKNFLNLPLYYQDPQKNLNNSYVSKSTNSEFLRSIARLSAKKHNVKVIATINSTELVSNITFDCSELKSDENNQFLKLDEDIKTLDKTLKEQRELEEDLNRTIPEAEITDASLQKKIQAELTKMAKDKLYDVKVILSGNWYYGKHKDTGVPSYRTLWFSFTCKDKNGNCYLSSNSIEQEYTGAGQYENRIFIENDIMTNEWEILLSPIKCESIK
ncbi:MAG: hypothetical protein GY810_08700 [Aureispira sp.]|nr:hypothetical protein [Aureispira sp.]